MEILNMILAIIVSGLGLPIGFLLAKAAKEELKAGKMYFKQMQKIIMVLMIFFVIYSFDIRLITFIAISSIFSALLIKINPNAIINYLIFAFLFAISLKDANTLILTSSLIFLYGLPTAALMEERGFKRYVKEELENPINIGYGKILMQKVKYVVWAIMLEIITIPVHFMKKKSSALYHLKFVCPICPSSRKKHRDVKGNSTCWWEHNWRGKRYAIPRHFGIINWIKQYTHHGTNLKEFKNYNEKIRPPHP